MVNGKLLDATVALGVWAIVIAVVLIILAQMQTIDIVGNSTINATLTKFIDGISEFGDWVSIIVVILVASFIIMLVMKALRRSQ